MKTWNFGVVGAGLIADFHARAIRDIPNAKFVACCDTNVPRAEALAQKYGGRAYGSYEEMLQSKDIDIVTIATPSGLHMEPTVAAAKAGKHVHLREARRDHAGADRRHDPGPRQGRHAAGRHLPVSFQRHDDPVARGDPRPAGFGTITYASVYVPWWRTDAYYEGFLARDRQARRRRGPDEPVDSHDGHALRPDAADRIGAGLHGHAGPQDRDRGHGHCRRTVCRRGPGPDLRHDRLLSRPIPPVRDHRDQGHRHQRREQHHRVAIRRREARGCSRSAAGS